MTDNIPADIRMVVTDLDNTLLRSDKSVSDYTRDVFRRLRERGILTVFATSRAFQASARFRAMITPDIDITSGGALASMNGKTLFRAAIDMETATAVIDNLRAHKDVSHIAVDTEDCYFNSQPIDKSWSGWIDYAGAVTTDFSARLPVADVFKITPNTTNAGVLREIAERFPSVDVLRFTGEDWFQIKSREASKQRAVAAVCERLAIPLSGVAAFGDDHNDVGMLRLCGVGVAVANAIPEAKAAAGYLCDTSDSDGVAKWLEKNVLHD